MNRIKKAEKDLILVKQALGLLNDKNLIWSADFDAIRQPLADYLKSETILRSPSPFAVHLADALLVEENDLTVR